MRGSRFAELSPALEGLHDALAALIDSESWEKRLGGFRGTQVRSCLKSAAIREEGYVFVFC
jgi:hypothetical protein